MCVCGKACCGDAPAAHLWHELGAVACRCRGHQSCPQGARAAPYPPCQAAVVHLSQRPRLWFARPCDMVPQVLQVPSLSQNCTTRFNLPSTGGQQAPVAGVPQPFNASSLCAAAIHPEPSPCGVPETLSATGVTMLHEPVVGRFASRSSQAKRHLVLLVPGALPATFAHAAGVCMSSAGPFATIDLRPGIQQDRGAIPVPSPRTSPSDPVAFVPSPAVLARCGCHRGPFLVSIFLQSPAAQ